MDVLRSSHSWRKIRPSQIAYLPPSRHELQVLDSIGEYLWHREQNAIGASCCILFDFKELSDFGHLLSSYQVNFIISYIINVYYVVRRHLSACSSSLIGTKLRLTTICWSDMRVANLKEIMSPGTKWNASTSIRIQRYVLCKNQYHLNWQYPLATTVT